MVIIADADNHQGALSSSFTLLGTFVYSISQQCSDDDTSLEGKTESAGQRVSLAHFFRGLVHFSFSHNKKWQAQAH